MKISISFSSKTLNLDEMTRCLGIQPTETRSIEDWPDSIKNNPKLPEYLQPRYIWDYTIQKDYCVDMTQVYSELIDLFQDKIDQINILNERYHLHSFINVVIYAKMEEFCPFIGLNRKCIAFQNAIPAEIGIEIINLYELE